MIKDNELAKEIDELLAKADMNAKDSWAEGMAKSIMFLTVKFLEENYNITKKKQNKN